MKFDPASKLKRLIDDVKVVGSCSQYEAMDLLRRVRLILEKGNVKRAYPILSLYCDWICHPELDQNAHGYRLLCDIDKIVADNHKSDLNNFILAVSDALSLQVVRESLIKIFLLNNIDTILFDEDRIWHEFARAIVDELCHRPISYPVDVRTNKKARGRSLFLQAVAYRDEAGIRSDITTTGASFIRRFEEDGNEFTFCWCVESRWENTEAGVSMIGPLMLRKSNAAT